MRNHGDTRGMALLLSLILLLIATAYGVYLIRDSLLRSEVSLQGIQRSDLHHQALDRFYSLRMQMVEWINNTQATMPLSHGSTNDCDHENQTCGANWYANISDVALATRVFFEQQIRPLAQAAGESFDLTSTANGISFVSNWKDLGKSRMRYRLTPSQRAIRSEDDDFGPSLIMTYDYEIEAENRESLDQAAIFARETGRLDLRVRMSPSFTQWGMIVDRRQLSQTGGTDYLYGNYSHNGVTRPAEFLSGRVFYGQQFSAIGDVRIEGTVVSEAAGPYLDDAPGYSGEPIYENWRQITSSAQDPVNHFPSSISNIQRLAAGDNDLRMPGDPVPAHDLRTVEDTQLIHWLGQGWEGSESIPGSAPDEGHDGLLDDGIYIPTIDPGGLKAARAGIYVKGNLSMLRLRVLRPVDLTASNIGSDLGPVTAFLQGNSNCSLQLLSLTHSAAGVGEKRIYMTRPECPIGERSLVITNQGSNAFESDIGLSINGQIYVDGSIAAMGTQNFSGPSSRSGAAIARNRQFNIGASGQITLDNDLQYEDARYVQSDQDPETQDTVIASNPWDMNPLDSSHPANVEPRIPFDSTTLLGISSKQNILLAATEDPSQLRNFNLHAVIYAGMDDDSCVINSRRGCGFGWPDPRWAPGNDNRNGHTADLGQLRVLGSITQRRVRSISYFNQGSHTFRGFVRSYHWDQRAKRLRLLGFPSSNAAIVDAIAIPTRSVEVGGSGDVARRDSN